MKNYNKMSNKNTEEINDNKTTVMFTSTLETTEPQPTIQKPIMGIVTDCKALNVRTCSNKEAAVIKVIGEGTMVTIVPIHGIEINDGWSHIKLEDGTHGYIMSIFLKEV